MTRTQISLDERQYRFAKRRAAERGLSLSAFLRALIDERMATEEERGGVMGLVGFFADGGVTAENLDTLLADGATVARRPPGEGTGS